MRLDGACRPRARAATGPSPRRAIPREASAARSSIASGGAIGGATVTIVYVETRFRRTLQSDADGRFSFPHVQPGEYRVEADAPAFEHVEQQVTVPLGRVQTVTLTLPIAGVTASVSVSAEPPILNTANPNTTTTFTAKAIESLPNPGGDITFPAQLSAGALMNTAGSGNDFVGGPSGFGNYQVNGLPGTSNGFIVDGLETNDPLTNLNSGLSTNLVLGLNSMAEVTVNTTSYRVDQGRYAASQVNYVTKSGTNVFHGNALRPLERIGAERHQLLQDARRRPETRYAGRALRRQSRRSGAREQIVLLRRFRAGPDSGADRDDGDGADTGV